MSTISEQREQVAGILKATFPDLAVYAYPPRGITPPCAFVTLGESTAQTRRGYWDARLLATLVAGAGDNEAIVETLEGMIISAAAALSDGMTTPVTWERPGQATIAGTQYLAVDLLVAISVELNGE